MKERSITLCKIVGSVKRIENCINVSLIFLFQKKMHFFFQTPSKTGLEIPKCDLGTGFDFH